MQIRRKMSAHTVMASIGRTLAHRRESKALVNEVRFAGDLNKDKLYEPKQNKKIIRVLTVIAYLISVSFVAGVLSLYYVFIWHPKEQFRPNVAKVECHNSPLSSPYASSSDFNGFHVNVTTIPTPEMAETESMKNVKSENTAIPRANQTNLLQILTGGRIERVNTTDFSVNSSMRKDKREQLSIERQVILTGT